MDYAYDLKGTTEHRYALRHGHAGEVLRDQNFAEELHAIQMPVEAHTQLMEVLHDDTEFLRNHAFTDYTLRVGIQVQQQEGKLPAGTFPGNLLDGRTVSCYITIIDTLRKWDSCRGCAKIALCMKFS